MDYHRVSFHYSYIKAKLEYNLEKANIKVWILIQIVLSVLEIMIEYIIIFYIIKNIGSLQQEKTAIPSCRFISTLLQPTNQFWI